MKSLIVILLATTLAAAQSRWSDDHPGPRESHGKAMLHKLNLTDEQQNQFNKLQSDLRKKQIALRSKIQSSRIDLRDEFRADKPDKGRVDSRISEISKLETEMKMNHVAFWFEVNKILTVDQQKLWKEHSMMGGPRKKHLMRHMRKDFRHDDD